MTMTFRQTSMFDVWCFTKCSCLSKSWLSAMVELFSQPDEAVCAWNILDFLCLQMCEQAAEAHKSKTGGHLSRRSRTSSDSSQLTKSSVDALLSSTAPSQVSTFSSVMKGLLRKSSVESFKNYQNQQKSQKGTESTPSTFITWSMSLTVNKYGLSWSSKKNNWM